MQEQKQFIEKVESLYRTTLMQKYFVGSAVVGSIEPEFQNTALYS